MGRESLRSHLQLFGRPRLTQPGGTVPFKAERRFRLLAVLAVAQTWLARAWLAELFWPERDTTVARGNLRKLLLETRRLNIEGLEESVAGVRWLIETDLADFYRSIADGDWRTASRLSCGPLMQDLEQGQMSAAFLAWLNYERGEAYTRWRNACLRAFDATGGVDADEVDDACARLLSVDPFDEEVLAAWLRVAGAAGRPDRADAAYRRYVHQLAEELGLEPSERLRVAADRARRPAVAAVPTPSAPTALLGRTQEIADIVALLGRAECRLVTLVGPGGVGKTRLARHLIETVAARYRAVWFVPLEDVTTPAALPGRIASQIDPDISLGDDPVGALARRWPREPSLIVLDGFEHLVDGAGLLEELLARAPKLQVVVTSRERLEAQGEYLLPLAGLGAPDPAAPADVVQSHPAVRLFAERAQQVRPSFDLTQEWRQVRSICAATEGLPLALELVAAWVRLLPIGDIERDLTGGASLLSSGPGGRSMQASFDHSWSLLTPTERDAFARLAVFRGGFSRDAALQVADVALPVLANLVDKSMLRVDPQGRFDWHALLHEWARAKLNQQPDLARQTTVRHGRWCLAYLLRNFGLVKGAHADKRRAIAAERDNVLHAWRNWVAAGAQAELEAAADVLSWFYVVEGRLPDGIALFARAAEALGGETSVVGAFMRAQQAWLELWMEHHDGARSMACQALKTLDAARHQAGAMMARRTIAHAARVQGRHAESARVLADALRSAQRTEDVRMLAILLDAAAMAWIMLGQYERAMAKLRSAMTLNDLVGNEAQRMYNEFNFSQALAHSGDATSALPWAEAAVRRAHEIGYRFFQPYSLCQRARVHWMLGNTSSAAADVQAALSLAESIEGRPAEVWALELRGRLALAAGDVDLARAVVRQGASHAHDAGNVLLGAPLVPVAAQVARARGNAQLAGLWLERLLACDHVQVPVQVEARTLLDPSTPRTCAGGGLLALLREIAVAL